MSVATEDLHNSIVDARNNNREWTVAQVAEFTHATKAQVKHSIKEEFGECVECSDCGSLCTYEGHGGWFCEKCDQEDDSK